MFNQYREFFFDPGLTGRELQSRIATRTPTTCIRIGDGEGVTLGQPDLSDPHAGPYLQTHFGHHLVQEQVDALSARLAGAVRRAWAIGVRQDVLGCELPDDIMRLSDDDRVAVMKAQAALREVERERMDPASAYRLALLNRVMTRGFETDAVLTSAWCHFDWMESGLLAEIAVQQGHIGLVSSRAGLADEFRAGGVEVDDWPVPARFIRRLAGWTPHFPDRYLELLETLRPAFPGQVFLVGAGILGKVYCDVIAERGGIAVDIGAVCDAWLGINTRPLVTQTRWGTDDIPSTLLLCSQLRTASLTSDQRCDT